MDDVLKEQQAYEGDYVARVMNGVVILEEVDDFILNLDVDTQE